MTTQQIVVLIILIVSFAILLFFIVKLGFGAETEKEICHNSVVTRGSAIVPTEVTPLDCQRQYICITADRDCDAPLTNPTKIRVDTKDEFYQALATELTDCWWVFGEGKINYVGEDKFENLYCSLCSQIAFDSSIKEKKIIGVDSFPKEDLYKYMAFTNMTGSTQTYSEYLFGTNNLDEISAGASFGDVNLDSQYYALMGMTSDISNLGWILGVGAAVAVTAGVVVSSVGTGGIAIPLWVAAGAAATAGGVAGGIGGSYIASTLEGESGNDYLSPSLIEAGSDAFKQLNCDYIVTKS